MTPQAATTAVGSNRYYRTDYNLRKHMKRKLLLAACAVLIFCVGVRAQGATDRKMRDAGLVDVLGVDSTLRVRLMYSTEDNFMGRDVYGDLERRP